MARLAVLCALGLATVTLGRAADIEGDVIIQRKLTKRKVTAPVNAYERGVTVPLGLSPDNDPDALAFERTHVVVYLEGDLPSNPASATMEQKNKQFVPDLLAVSVGSTISFPNLDPIFHNVFSLSKAKEFDLGNYPKDKTRLVTFPKSGVVFVNCHLHPNMTAVIVVSPNSFKTRPDANGRFLLSGVPPGAYTVVAWHKAAGFFRQRITLTDGQTASVKFIIPILAAP
jgi:plastocyanin